MQRYFVRPEQMTDTKVRIEGEDVHHLARVMRMKQGDRIICCDGRGRDVLAAIETIHEQYVLAAIVKDLENHRELPVDVTVAQSLPKGDKMDWIVQKCTEMGARRIIPFTSSRTVVLWNDDKMARRRQRWQKIAKEAAEQAHRSIVPVIDPPVSWEQMLAIGRQTDVALLAYEGEGTVSLKRVLQSSTNQSHILLVIGPEGGFDAAEVEQAVANEMVPVSLGRRILRTETAALYALAAISYQFEFAEENEGVRRM